MEINWQPNHLVACLGTVGVHIQTPRTVLTHKVVTPSVYQVENRMVTTMIRDIDAPVLRENCMQAAVVLVQTPQTVSYVKTVCLVTLAKSLWGFGMDPLLRGIG